jgi:uncharacterized protein (TIGR03086 family)
MATDLLDLYRRGSAWANEKVAGAAERLDDATPCDEWSVRSLLDHMLETQRYFLASARGEHASPPSPTPPALISDEPARDFEHVREEMLSAFADPGVVEKTAPALGIAFTDELVHGWDLARATDQDATMPDGLAAAAYELIHGKFTEEQRKNLFKPAVTVDDDASPQTQLLAYTGREPA